MRADFGNRRVNIGEAIGARLDIGAEEYETSHDIADIRQQLPHRSCVDDPLQFCPALEDDLVRVFWFGTRLVVGDADGATCGP
jgi:hypothetical protein